VNLAAVFILALVCPPSASATHLTVRVLNVSRAVGVVRVALCREAQWARHDCSFGAQAPATVGVVEVSLEAPPGVYGILVHHDMNGDGQVDRTFLGLPREGVGFSRNARIRFGFPSFSTVSLPVAGDAASATVTLMFEPPGAVVNAQ
jgi:uncharacterized protein (DUF2141 family)